jgi:hypothetical protein
MPPQPFVHGLLRDVCFVTTIALAGAFGVSAQETAPPAYLASVDGQATLERDGAVEPASRNMPFVPGDRVRTGAGRVEIAFPDGSGIEVGEYSEVEAVSATRVRLLAGTMDHLQRQAAPASRSAGYLPPDLQTYGNTFDRYGSWQYDSSYGNVWYPTVGPEWRPYSYGSWSPIRSYGWTWVGLDAWAWPTHHYGRWGYARNSWFWIPGRTWGAAWVSWSFADDYVSWCPLGYDSRPVFALSVGHRRGWDNWTVPRRTFETRGYGRNYASYYRAGPRESAGGRREPFIGNRDGRSTGNERTTNADRRTTADYRRPPQARTGLPAATGGAVAVPRAGARESVGNRDSGFGIRNRPPTTDYRRPTADYRQRTDVAVPRATVPARVGSRESVVGSRESAVESRDRRAATGYRPPATEYRRPSTEARPPATDYRRPTTDSRPTTDYRRPTTDSRPPTTDSRPPTTDSRRAAPSGGDARPRAQERSTQGQGQGQGQGPGRRR